MIRLLCGIVGVLMFQPNGTHAIADDAQVSFHRDLMPILRIHCVACHKPGKLKGGLDLTTAAALFAGSDTGEVIKPGYPEASRLIETIHGDEPEMPQESEPLLAAEVELIRRWVVQGAKVDEPISTPGLACCNWA